MPKNMGYFNSVSLAALIGCVLANQSVAQESTAFREEIVVTAQKRQQALSDVSIAANVIDGRDLAKANIFNSEDFAKLASNVSINSSVAGQMPNVVIRGVGAAANAQFANSSNPVALNLDGIYLTTGIFAAFPLFDLERIEILKGPQTTLYGRNASAGAVNFISKKPDQEFGGYLNASFQRFEELRTEGAINIPVSDSTQARVSMMYNYGDGHLKNELTGDNTGGPDVWAGRAGFASDFDSGLKISGNIHGYIDRSEPRLYTHAGLNGPGCDVIAKGELPPMSCVDDFGYSISTRDRRIGEWNLDERRNTRMAGALLDISKEFDVVRLSWVGAYDVGRREAADDQDASPLNTVDLLFDEKAWQWSQEFLLSSVEEEQFFWMIGASISDAHLKMNRLAPEIFNAFDITYESEQDNFAAALFGQVEYQLTDSLRLVGSARLNYEQKKSFLDNAFVDSITGEIISARCDPGICSGNKDWLEPAYKAVLEYRSPAGNLYYASYTHGFKSGGFPGGITTAPAAYRIYDPEFVDAFEMGVKLRDSSGRFGLSSSAFYYKYKDLQETTLVVGAVPGSVVQAFANAGEAEVYGLDLELSYNADGLSLLFLVGLLDAEYTDFTLPPGSGTTDLDLTGNDLVNAPKVNLTGVVSYDIALNNIIITPRVEMRYRSSTWWTAENLNVLAEKSYLVGDASVSIADADNEWRLSAYVKNFTDKVYRINAGISPVNSLQQNYALPRIWGVSLGLNF